MELRIKQKSFPIDPKNIPTTKLRNEFHSFTQYDIGLKFKCSEWDQVLYRFYIDTGAVISYAPDFIMEYLQIKSQFEYDFMGVNRKEECKVKTKLAKVNVKIIDDEGQESPELFLWFAFHPFEKTFLLGMKDFLDQIGIKKDQGSSTMILSF